MSRWKWLTSFSTEWWVPEIQITLSWFQEGAHSTRGFGEDTYSAGASASGYQEWSGYRTLDRSYKYSLPLALTLNFETNFYLPASDLSHFLTCSPRTSSPSITSSLILPGNATHRKQIFPSSMKIVVFQGVQSPWKLHHLRVAHVIFDHATIINSVWLLSKLFLAMLFAF